ncbi:MAG TPA: DUF4230 domain-containing protein [Gemmatimonadaceae bacterium]|nr:DUF4230 domain-containing protein [Gemmatimonadaceae bacterium]
MRVVQGYTCRDRLGVRLAFIVGMTAPPRSFARAPLPWAVIALVFLLLVAGYCTMRTVAGVIPRGGTTVTHDVVIQRMRAVAKLVSSEATVRDVVVYENTRFGSTKKTLVVVTGKLLAGINLGASPSVRIDHASKRIGIDLPPAELLGVEVLNMRTYDERAGLWNPFTAEDRDLIQRQVRAQLVQSGNDMRLLEHANRSAVEMLRTMLSQDGYTVEVRIRGQVVPSGIDK